MRRWNYEITKQQGHNGDTLKVRWWKHEIISSFHHFFIWLFIIVLSNFNHRTFVLSYFRHYRFVISTFHQRNFMLCCFNMSVWRNATNGAPYSTDNFVSSEKATYRDYFRRRWRRRRCPDFLVRSITLSL